MFQDNAVPEPRVAYRGMKSTGMVAKDVLDRGLQSLSLLKRETKWRMRA